MDLKQLRYFLTIANEGQITRAAKKLHMAQPPLSQQLKLLEQELGVRLIERNGRSIELTEAGKTLHKRAEILLQQADETIAEVKETGEGLRGKLSIGCVKTCFAYIPERTRLFRKQYPEVTFELREGDSYSLAQALNNKDIELAIVRLPLEMKDYSSIALPTEPFVPVVPKQWVTNSSQGSIQMEELAQMPLLLLHRISGVGLYELVIDKFRQHGLKPNVVCECPDAAMLLALVNAGVGATLLPKSALSALPVTGGNILELTDAQIKSESAVIWLRDRYLSKSATRFIETFKAGEPR